MAGLRKHLEEMVGGDVGQPHDAPQKGVKAPVKPREREPETKPSPPADGGDVCPVCGRKGRAPGHH